MGKDFYNDIPDDELVAPKTNLIKNVRDTQNIVRYREEVLMKIFDCVDKAGTQGDTTAMITTLLGNLHPS